MKRKVEKAKDPGFPGVPDVIRQRMARIRKTDTKPELVVRRLCHALGYRFRLHRRDLPGRPDLAFIGRRKVIFVHGCFWHQHDCPLGKRRPKTRHEYWLPKLARNVERDELACRDLELLGWGVLIIWECETNDLNELTNRVLGFLGEQ